MKLSNSDRKNALKHTYVKIILILLRMSWKLFALRHILYWVYVFMWYANSFLHPLLPKIIVVLLFVHGLDEIRHSTLVKKGSCYWTCSGIFLYWRGNLFYFAAWDWSQSQMGIPLGLHSWFNATHKNPVV